MAVIDEGVVTMKFQNNQFLDGIRSTLSALAGLKQNLKFDGASKGLTDVGGAALTMGTQVEGVSGKFLALATVAVTALTRITNAAITAGSQWAKSLTLDPIMAGFREYETNMTSIQTVLANTQAAGKTLTDVNAALNELNEYSDKTIYNFSEMARNIGTFTAAGVDLDTATGSIKGIANLAALSGSSSSQAASAMYQLSQAISAGRVSLVDWNSVVNAGMGGTVFQRALAQTATQMGTLSEGAVTLEGDMQNVSIAGKSFRDSIDATNGPSWLTSDVLTATLQQFTGDMTDAELATMGFNETQIASIQAQAQTAVQAATVVKTASGLMSTLAESAGSGWAKSFQIIVGDFEEAKALFTGINNVVGGMLGRAADARNELLQGWKDLGGRNVAIEAIKNAFNALLAIAEPIREAFRTIFPPATAQTLYNITVAIRDFTAGLMISRETATDIRRVFGGVFAIFSIGVEFVKALATALFGLTDGMGSGASNVLDFVAGIGDFIVELDTAIKQGDLFTKFFDNVGKYVKLALDFIRPFAEAIGSMFDGLDTSLAAQGLDKIRERLAPLGSIGEVLASVWAGLGPVFARAWAVAQPIIKGVAEFFDGLGDSISAGLEGVSYSQFLDTLNTGLFAALTLAVSKFTTNGIKIDIGVGALQGIKDAFGGLTDTLTVMQTNLKAGTLQKIAIAVALLTASIIGLSFIDSAALTKSLTGITVMFVELLIVMALLEKFATKSGFIKLPFIAASLVGLSVAILILSAAVRSLSGLTWEELAKGLTGVGVALGLLAATAVVLDKHSGSMLRASVGMIAIAVAVKILASAVEQFSALNWEEMGKGLAGLGATLLALGIFTRIADAGKAGISQGAGLILLAVALKVIASVLQDFGAMSVEEIAKGLITMAGALLIIAGAMALMQGTLLGAAALLVVAGALTVLTGVLETMGGMGWEEIAKSMVVLAGSLLILAGGLYLMTAALPGAAALIVAAGALMLLAPALILLGTMSWDAIGKGLTALAGALLVLAVGGTLMLVALPGLLGLGIAIGVIGAGVFLAATGLALLAGSIAGLAVAGSAGAGAIAAFAAAIIAVIPAAAAALAVGIVKMVEQFTLAAPTFLAAGIAMIDTVAQAIIQSTPIILATLTALILMLLQAIEVLIPRFIEVATKIIMALLDAITKIGPKVISTLTTLITSLVNAIAKMVPQFVTKGMEMITGILNGIAKNVGQIVTAGTNIIISFLNGVQQNFPRVAQKGAELIISFVNTLANTIRNNQAAMNSAGQNLASAIISGMTSGLRNGAGAVAGAARSAAQSALNSAKSALGIKSPSREFRKVGRFSMEGMAQGLRDIGSVTQAAADMGTAVVTSARLAVKRRARTIFDSVDMQPRIRPVVDLTDLKKGVGEANEAMKSLSDFNIDGSRYSAYNEARDIARRASLRRQAEQRAGAETGDFARKEVNYVQNNYSPKALSPVEVYRNTKSQLATIQSK